MKEAGLIAFSLKRENRSKIYSHEKAPSDLDPDYQRQFKRNKVASDFFAKQAPSYKKVVIHWILSAKREETRQTRLGKVIKESEQLKRLK